MQVIKDWVSNGDHRKIRDYFYGKKVDKKHKQQAELLSNMLEKYDSYLNKSETIYRGIFFICAVKEAMSSYKILIKFLSNILTEQKSGEIDEAPSSFSRDINVARKRAGYLDPRVQSVIFVLRSRCSKELYVKDLADEFANEEEIVVKSNKAIYRVVDIRHKSALKVTEIEIEEVPCDEGH